MPGSGPFAMRTVSTFRAIHRAARGPGPHIAVFISWSRKGVERDRGPWKPSAAVSSTIAGLLLVTPARPMGATTALTQTDQVAGGKLDLEPPAPGTDEDGTELKALASTTVDSRWRWPSG